MLNSIFGTPSSRFVRSCKPAVARINAQAQDISALADSALKAKTEEFRKRINEHGEKTDKILPEAFAVVREAAKRALGLYHYDVQLIGGIILHNGMIAEMRTGEGKTLVATLAAYLNALSGKGAHVITVNDYLAARDAEWMGRVYGFLGLTTGCITGGMDDFSRKAAYAADITYGTNNEFGFDYLRDNMKFTAEDMVQRPLHFAVVDEIDSILIDEARTPLIISGQAERSTGIYTEIDKIIPRLAADDYEVEEKSKNVSLTDKGAEHVENLLREAGLVTEGQSLYDISHISLLHHINQALVAHKMYTKDRDYIVHEGKIVIIDEFTGRMMADRRFSDGLHQALEAKEDVTVRHENQTLASITFQNYFRMYKKLSGMTGTAKTEEKEFGEIYGLRVIEVPTNKKVARIDEDDAIYRTEAEKFDAILETIKDCAERKQPTLVGTVSIEKSEKLAKALTKAKIDHEVLNAKQHEREALIIAQAGRPGRVTIATNMAGRGTDIVPGGNAEMMFEQQTAEKDLSEEEAKTLFESVKAQCEQEKKTVLEAGGLYVLGTERHESRRIDNQLRGRTGRQGDPGYSKFFLSLEDDLMRIFGSDKLRDSALMKGLEPGEVISHSWLSRVIAKAQQRVERHHFDIRKNLLRFDGVMNEQRSVIYERRKDFIETDTPGAILDEMAEDVISDIVDNHVPERSYPEDWDIEGLENEAHRVLGLHLPLKKIAEQDGVTEKELEEYLLKSWKQLMAAKEAKFTQELLLMARRKILLLTLDQLWKEHLLTLDHLKQGIGLRAHGQKDPLSEYKREAFDLFYGMIDNLRVTAVLRAAHLEISEEDRRFIADYSRFAAQAVEEGHGDETAVPGAEPQAAQEGGAVLFKNPKRRSGVASISAREDADGNHVGRNSPCPCGSGKKYKHCCGNTAAMTGTE